MIFPLIPITILAQNQVEEAVQQDGHDDNIAIPVPAIPVPVAVVGVVAPVAAQV